MNGNKSAQINGLEEKSYIELDRLKLAELEDSLQENSLNQYEFIQTNNRIKWKDALPQVFF